MKQPSKADLLSRRAALKLLTQGGASLVPWRANEALAGILVGSENPRRFTGSRQDGLFSGNRFPVTNNPGEGKEQIDPERWHGYPLRAVVPTRRGWY